MGGSGDPAHSAIEAALKSGKSVVTANKALIAKHGLRLAALAEQHRGALNYEAAVGAAIPVIKTLREGLAGTTINRVYGILNGTVSYTDADGEGRSVVRRMPEGRPASRLCRSRSVVRCRRARHRAEAVDPGEPGFRHACCAERGLCRRHFLDRAGRSSRRRGTWLPGQAVGGRGAYLKRHRAAGASDHGAENVVYRTGHGRHQRGNHRWRGHPSDHTCRSGCRRSRDCVCRGSRYRRCRVRHSGFAVRPALGEAARDREGTDGSATRAVITSG